LSSCTTGGFSKRVQLHEVSRSPEWISTVKRDSANMFSRQWIHITIEELLGMCVYGSVFISLLGNNTAKTFQRQRKIVGDVVFSAVRVISDKYEISSSQNFLLILRAFSVFLFCSFLYIAKPLLSPFFQHQILNCTSSRNLISNSISSLFSSKIQWPLNSFHSDVSAQVLVNSFMIEFLYTRYNFA
jgi:hypothetical protein